MKRRWAGAAVSLVLLLAAIGVAFWQPALVAMVNSSDAVEHARRVRRRSGDDENETHMPFYVICCLVVVLLTVGLLLLDGALLFVYYIYVLPTSRQLEQDMEENDRLQEVLAELDYQIQTADFDLDLLYKARRRSADELKYLATYSNKAFQYEALRCTNARKELTKAVQNMGIDVPQDEEK